VKNLNGFARKSLVPELARIVGQEGDYLSHSTALFFLGQIPHLPKVITVVSQHRRRNREVDGIPLVFILHPPSRMKPVQTISIGKENLYLSTLEKTLIDLLADLDHAPPFDELVKLFVNLPFETGQLINLAKITSDSVLKRTAFLLAWSGRAAFKEIPFSAFSRTPVKIDPREKNSEHNWDNRFFIRYPAKLLSFEIIPGPNITDSRVLEWAQLRSFPEFIRAIKNQKLFPIREDPSEKSPKWLDSFFTELFRSLSAPDFKNLLGNFFASTDSPKRGRFFPKLFLEWLEKNPAIFPIRKHEIIPWVTANLDSPNPDHLESALFFGFHLGLHDEVIGGLARNGHRLFNFGRFRQIQFLSEEYLKQKREIPSTIFVLAARSLARLGKNEQAIAILDEGKKRFENRENSETDCGDLAYAMGNIFRVMNRYDESLAQLYLAREFYLAVQDHRGVGLTDIALGNLFFTRGRIREAKGYYLNSLSIMKSLGLKDPQASALGNLGLIEYDSGRLRRAALYLMQAQNLHKMRGNQWNVATISISRAKILLTMGHFTHSARVLKEAHALKTKVKHVVGIYESSALLAWTNDLMGRASAAKAWWDSIPTLDPLKEEPRVLFVVNCLKAMTALFKGDLTTALELYREVYRMAEKREVSSPAIGDSLHCIGFCQTFLGHPEAPATLKKAWEALSGNPARVQVRLLKLFSCLFFPTHFPEFSLEENALRYMETQAFDPFWGFYAKKLLENSSIPALKKFLDYHFRKSPPGMIQTMIASIPDFGEVLKKIQVDRQRAAEFLTFISDGAPRPIHLDDYKSWRETPKTNSFTFDGPSGIVSFGANLAYLKPGSIPHGVLTQLISAVPHPVDLESLYRFVWGSQFDPECDLGAIKSAVQRLQKSIKSVNPAVRIRRKKTKSVFGGLEIIFPCRWEAVI